MLSRSQILAVLISSSLLLSGCATTEPEVDSAYEEAASESSAVTPTLTDAEYQEALERILAEEELAAELLARVEGNKKVSSDDTTETTSSAAQSLATASSEDDAETASPRVEQGETFPIGSRAYSEVAALFDNSHKFLPENVLAHEDIEPEIVSDVVSYLSRASSTWDEEYGVIDDFTVYLFRKDSAAWGDQMRIYNGDRIARGSFVEDVKISSSGRYCGFVYIIQNRVYACIADSGTRQDFLGSVIPHEYFHGITYRLGIDHTNFPIWLAEGLASYIGDVYGISNHKSLNSKVRNWHDFRMSQRFGHSTLQSFAKEMTIDDVRLIFGKLEGYTNETAQQLIADYNAYVFGGVAAENLIGTFGIDTVMDFVSAVGRGTYWETAFSKYFDQSVDLFYENMLVYIQDNYSQ